MEECLEKNDVMEERDVSEEGLEEQDAKMEFLEQFDLPTDDLPGVLPIAEHDALVHDDPLGGLHLLPPGHSDDVEVRAEEE